MNVARRFPGPVALLVGVLTASCGRAMPVGAVDRFDTTVVVRTDGSLDVREDIGVSSRATPGAVLVRAIEPREADSVHVTAIRLDGMSQGGPSQGITADNRGKRLTVEWRLPANLEAGHVLTLEYEVFSAVRVDEPRAYVHWQALPAGRGFTVAHSELILTLPPGVPFYGGTGIAEAGWAVERTATGIVANRQKLPDAEPATLLAEFDLRPTMAESDWQVDEHRQWNLLPSYVAGALFMLVIGGGTQWILRLQYPKRRRRDPDEASATATSDPERLVVARGLRTTAWVGSLVAIACGGFVYAVLPRLGPWVQLIPGSMVVVAMMFVFWSRGWAREAGPKK